MIQANHLQGKPIHPDEVKKVCALQGQQGWDVLRACNAVKKEAQAEGFEAGVKAAAAIHKRASRVRALPSCLSISNSTRSSDLTLLFCFCTSIMNATGKPLDTVEH